MNGQIWDVFISYAHQDAEWVKTLAENLHNKGFKVFIDEWEIGPGDVLVYWIDEGILKAKKGVLLVTPESLSRPWVLEEYAAMLRRAVAGERGQGFHEIVRSISR